MTVDDCIQAIRDIQNLDAVCVVDISNNWLANAQAVAVILSSLAVIAAAVFAWIQVGHLRDQIHAAKTGVITQIDAARDSQRLTETLNMLIQIQTNSHWIEKRKKFITLRDSKEGLKQHAAESSEDAISIRAMLNQYELIAIGIKQGILDKEMYRKFYRGTLVKDWMASVQFIDVERKDNDRYWIELQHLAEMFQSET